MPEKKAIELPSPKRRGRPGRKALVVVPSGVADAVERLAAEREEPFATCLIAIVIGGLRGMGRFE